MKTFNILFKKLIILFYFVITYNSFSKNIEIDDSVFVNINKIKKLNNKKIKFSLKISNISQKDLFIELPDSSRDKMVNWRLINKNELVINLHTKDSVFKLFKTENYLYDTIIINSCISNSPLLYKLKYQRQFIKIPSTSFLILNINCKLHKWYSV